jgi:hypothetical protein
MLNDVLATWVVVVVVADVEYIICNANEYGPGLVIVNANGMVSVSFGPNANT